LLNVMDLAKTLFIFYIFCLLSFTILLIARLELRHDLQRPR